MRSGRNLESMDNLGDVIDAWILEKGYQIIRSGDSWIAHYPRLGINEWLFDVKVIDGQCVVRIWQSSAEVRQGLSTIMNPADPNFFEMLGSHLDCQVPDEWVDIGGEA